ncbi:hypothetical protein TVAG_214040 [Trichomonas vaginalis G3]|uniref:Uncharacterized protein n=1 Tax=Trichomonas vaginalis (strain ATCC PRA-98 / G3) TaxID=412133 RepID=A2DK08_TRIV3|nr:hypothetical protein TVAGG3_0169340 [Trichomonas vaginalis G3]EAY19179.1 hypothetical protein TVAG_214040 [Trichomonas vaginalis G3]KAI5548463.1 hypothetical protein TVAGG3_0169340 [Trichomonas vaginalis G3]|eukprot:XP_001580165.1 hypothetical protein [Trichomonas vaginalis G3]
MSEIKVLEEEINKLSASTSIFTHKIEDKAVRVIIEKERIFLIDCPLLMRIKLMMKQDETKNPIATIQELLENNHFFDKTIKYNNNDFPICGIQILSKDNENDQFKEMFQNNIQKFKEQYKKYTNEYDKEYFTLATLPSGFIYFRNEYSIRKFMELIEDANSSNDLDYLVDLILSLILYDVVFIDNLHEFLIEFGDFRKAFNESIPFMHEIQQQALGKIVDNEELFGKLLTKVASFLNITWKYSPLLPGKDLLKFKVDSKETKEKLDLQVYQKTFDFTKDDTQKDLLSSAYDAAFLSNDPKIKVLLENPETRLYFFKFGQPLFRGQSLGGNSEKEDEETKEIKKKWKSITADHKEAEFLQRIKQERPEIQLKLLQIYKQKLEETKNHISKCIERFNDKIIFDSYAAAIENEWQRLGYALVAKFYNSSEEWFQSVVKTFQLAFGKRIPTDAEFVKKVLKDKPKDAIDALNSHYNNRKYLKCTISHIKFSSILLKIIFDKMKDAALIIFLNQNKDGTGETFTSYDQWVMNVFFKKDGNYGTKLLIMKRMEYITRDQSKNYNDVIDELDAKFDKVFEKNKEFFTSIKSIQYDDYIEKLKNSDSPYLTVEFE